MAELRLFYPLWVLPAAPAVECVRVVAEAGFDGIQFGAAPTDDPRRLDAMTSSEADALRAVLRERALGRSLHVLSDLCFLGMAERDEQVVRAAKRSIEGAVRTLTDGCDEPLIVSNDPVCLPPGRAGVVAPQLIVEMLEFLKLLAERYPILPALEPWPKPQTGTPEALASLVGAAGGGIGILLDTGHVNMALNAPWCQHRTVSDFIESLPAPVLEVHLHDNHGREDEHLPPGEGDADLRGMLALLLRRGFNGPVTLETDLNAPGRPGLAEGMRRARALCTSAVF
jgi:sugar phosphate isomerase/epimerase